MIYPIGALVRARGREWVVQPDSTEKVLLLRPLGGKEEENTGLITELEQVEQASFLLPDATNIGDHLSCRLLRDAMQLGFRSTAGPFRSFGHINVDPRPYQFVPLIMALRMDPVRLLIADDVGVGKTIEAGLIARELLDRGDATSMAVLCPPHLAEQWKRELKDKFHIDAELVLSNTAAKLERDIGFDKSLFDVYPYTVVSLDYIKTEKRRIEFERACPELVIVDEAHSCTQDMSERGARQMRWELLNRIANDPKNPGRHLLLLTATPHSGKEDNFRSLLSLLNKEFKDFPLDLEGDHNKRARENLSKYFIQRRRADVRSYMKEYLTEAQGSSPFPDREFSEKVYSLNPQYHALLDQTLNWAKNVVKDYTINKHSVTARVQWWSALALLHAISSSPAAAEATLKTRTGNLTSSSITEVDEYGQATVLDGEAEELENIQDFTPGADHYDEHADRDRRILLNMAKQAHALFGNNDPKLLGVVPIVNNLLKDGYNPIIFCRYIHTAEYLATELCGRIDKKHKAEVWAVTGKLAPEEREERIAELGKKDRRVLIATDCLSEGINLQEHFDAVLHYDLAWNPTRHEQREGRVDRYGQPKSTIRTITYYGKDNAIDGIILNVLLRKHESIRKALGVSVPIPADSNSVAEAIFEGLLISKVSSEGQQMVLELIDQSPAIEKEWQRAADREQRSRTIFAQHGVKAHEVVGIWKEAEQALGSSRLKPFIHSLCSMHNIPIAELCGGVLDVDFSNVMAVRTGMQQAADTNKRVKLKFELPVKKGEIYVNRTHPIVEGLANHIFLDALDSNPATMARRAGVIRTSEVQIRTVLLLIRCRYNLLDRKANRTIKETLVEESFITAWQGTAANPLWLDDKRIEELLLARPTGNVLREERIFQFEGVLQSIPRIASKLGEIAEKRAQVLLDQHNSIRQAAGIRGSTQVHPIKACESLPVDILGIYILIP